MTPRFILAVTDFSAHGHHVLDRAALLCAEHGAQLTLAHLACPGEAPPPDATTRLARHARQLAQAHAIVAHAAPRTAASLQDLRTHVAEADLVVWGTATPRSLRALLNGPPVAGLLRTARRPVLIARHAARAPYRRLLVAVDLSAPSQPLIELGLSFGTHAAIDVVHAIDPADEGKLRYAEVSGRAIQAYRQQCRQHAQRQLLTLTDSVQAERGRVMWTLVHGEPTRQIVLQQQHSGADLIVVGRRPSSALSDVLFGSMAMRLLGGSHRNAEGADVLVVPHDWQPAAQSSTACRPLMSARFARRRLRAGPPEPPLGPNPAAVRP